MFWFILRVCLSYWWLAFPIAGFIAWKYLVSPILRVARRSTNFFTKPYLQDIRSGPFDEDTLIHDVYEKDKLLHEEFDVIFIGAGSSGLCGASYAAQEGMTVLLLEQNEQLGGFTHSFVDEETGLFEFDVGMHKVAMDEKFQMLFDKASEGKLEWGCMSEVGEPTSLCYVNGEPLVDYRGLDIQRKFVLSKFSDPFDQECINSYFDDCDRLFPEYDHAMMLRYYVPSWLRPIAIWFLETFLGERFFKLNEITGVEYLQQMFPRDTPSQDTLRGLFSHWWFAFGYINEVPGVWGPLINGLESRFGGYFPAHGCSDFAKKITRVIVRHGGQALVNANVKRIVLSRDQKKVLGVELENGDMIRSKRVVSSCGLANTCSLLPQETWPLGIEEYTRPAMFFIQCFLGFSKNWEDLGLPHSDIYMMRTDVEHTNGDDPNEVPSLKFGYDYFYAGNSTPTYSIGENKCTLNLLIISTEERFKRWEGTSIRSRGAEYLDAKEEFARPYLDALYEKYPLLLDSLEVESISTRLSTKHWCASSRGESYGAATTSKRLFEMYDKGIKGWKIDGLIVSSADACTSDGVLMGATSGLLAAGEMLGRDLLIEWKVAMMLMDDGTALEKDRNLKKTGLDRSH